MLLQNMDEMNDIKPTVTLEGKQVELLKLDSVSVGMGFQLMCMAKLVNINQSVDEDGTDGNRLTFELSAIELIPEEKEYNMSAMYPNSPPEVR